MFVVPIFVMLAHMFSMSKEHILISFLISMVSRSVLWEWSCIYCMNVYMAGVCSYVTFALNISPILMRMRSSS